MNIKGIQSTLTINSLQNNESVKGTQEKQSQEAQGVQKTENQQNATLQQEPEKMKQNLEEIVEGLNEMAQIFNRGLDFAVHEETHRLMVKVIDKETDEVIREIPPKEILDMVAKMQDTFSVLLDVRA